MTAADPAPTAADHARTPVLIGLDWGTSALRAWLFDAAGTALARLTGGPGVMAVPPDGFRAAFEAFCAPWLAAHPGLPVLAAGMVGSRQGWREAPYAHAPAGFGEIAAGLIALDDDAGRVLRLVPGVRAEGRQGSIDVMRGEETQVFGALAARSVLQSADAAHRDGLFVLPGTHSKWVEMRAGRIVALRTYLTGETWAVLRQHSILGRLAADPPADDASAQAGAAEAFDRGVRLGLASPGELLHLLFLVRTEGLFDRLRPTQTPAFLSGLLTGAEVADALVWSGREMAPTLIGDDAQAARYARALALAGVIGRAAPADCTAQGLFAIARAAGLAPHPPASSSR
ncbi:MAG: 2-dehydro-3-deoxygalactonokinase [Betaproteobacteria bacterium]|nr:2-dehydro-3-deoxygalactonokinase [Betaproteobacteria bacterium]